MLNKENLIALAIQVAKADPTAPVAYSFNDQNLSYEALNETLRKEFNELSSTHSLYRENKNLIFSIIEQTIDNVLPKKVVEQYQQFAEVKNFGNNETVKFKRKITSNKRAKQFITRVGLAGRYECFKLSKGEETFEVPTSAIGGAAQIGFEEYLDGRVDFAELLTIVMDGMTELIYKEIGHNLKASVNQLPPANKVAANGFVESAMDGLINIARAYGTPTIYCTYEFAVKMLPKDAWRYTENMKKELWETGRLATYKGTQVIILEQGFEDETNSKKVIDPGYAWVIPTGVDTKPVKVAFQGEALVDEAQNQDRSREIQVYKKVGVVTMLANDICCYRDSSLAGQMTTWSLDGTASIRDYTGTTH